MQISVSIVSFNTKELLQLCIENLLSQKTKHSLEIVVLDNNSSDGSAEMVEKSFPKVKLIKSQQNTGFAKGQNEILKQVKGEYVLILNPDTNFPEDTIENMVLFMEKNPNCGIASCKILTGSNNLDSNGGDFPFNLSLFSWLFNLEFFGIKTNFHKTEKEYYESAHEVDWVGGTFMFVKQEVFQKIGFFNEDYFMYFEDVDFCYKAKVAGFKIMINPEVSITHQSGASSKNPRFNQWKGEFWGIIHFYNKKFGMAAGLIIKLLIYCAVMLRIIIFSLLGRFKIAKVYAKVLGEI